MGTVSSLLPRFYVCKTSDFQRWWGETYSRDATKLGPARLSTFHAVGSPQSRRISTLSHDKYSAICYTKTSIQ